MSWVKGDGAKIKITFDKTLTGEASGNQSHFTVTAKEYNWVPDGTLQSVVKTVLSTEAGSTAKEVVLNMVGTTRFESAVELTVAYDGLGTLVGSTGNVEAFSQTFVPTELIPKPDQRAQEHIEISALLATGILTKISITTTATQEGGHVEIVSFSATGTLTHVNDL